MSHCSRNVHLVQGMLNVNPQITLSRPGVIIRVSHCSRNRRAAVQRISRQGMLNVQLPALGPEVEAEAGPTPTPEPTLDDSGLDGYDWDSDMLFGSEPPPLQVLGAYSELPQFEMIEFSPPILYSPASDRLPPSLTGQRAVVSMA